MGSKQRQLLISAILSLEPQSCQEAVRERLRRVFATPLTVPGVSADSSINESQSSEPARKRSDASPLLHCCIHNQPEAIEYILDYARCQLEKDAATTICNSEDFYDVSWRNADVANIEALTALVGHPNETTEDLYGNTTAHYAASHGNWRLVECIVDLIHLFSHRQVDDFTQQDRATSANTCVFHWENENGDTPVMVAAHAGHVSFVRQALEEYKRVLLSQNGTLLNDPSILDKVARKTNQSGDSILSIAIGYGHVQLIEFLVSSSREPHSNLSQPWVQVTPKDVENCFQLLKESQTYSRRLHKEKHPHARLAKTKEACIFKCWHLLQEQAADACMNKLLRELEMKEIEAISKGKGQHSQVTKGPKTRHQKTSRHSSISTLANTNTKGYIKETMTGLITRNGGRTPTNNGDNVDSNPGSSVLSALEIDVLSEGEKPTVGTSNRTGRAAFTNSNSNVDPIAIPTVSALDDNDARRAGETSIVSLNPNDCGTDALIEKQDVTYVTGDVACENEQCGSESSFSKPMLQPVDDSTNANCLLDSLEALDLNVYDLVLSSLQMSQTLSMAQLDGIEFVLRSQLQCVQSARCWQQIDRERRLQEQAATLIQYRVDQP
jgi:ankyrin repeat protein